MSLAVHNVVHLSDAEVVDRFLVRQHELDELLTHLREDAPSRHALVIGPRGMGKSLLLRRVAIAVTEDAELAARWLPVVMAEELYEVTSIGELWLAALARLAAIVDDADLASQYRALLAEPDPSRLEKLGLQRLLAAARALGKRVLLLAENVDMLLDDQVSAEEGWTLRQALQTEPELLLIASAVTTFAQVDEAGEALYGFFHRVELRPLDVPEVRALWLKVTGIDLDGNRAVPIRILTGGNPRLITVLGRFAAQPDLGSLREDLELLIDEYTPYFKANIEILPAVERKVFVILADIWAPATAAEVAAKARLDSNKVSSLLGRLMRRGAVQVADVDDGRRRYELTERLYNLYHLLRRPSVDGRVRALVDILVHLYEPADLHREVWPHIVRPRVSPGPMSDVDVAIASGLHRHLDDAETWDERQPSDLIAARPLFEFLLTAQRATLGDDHVDTLLTRQQIAFCVTNIDDPAAGLPLYEEILRDQERVLGPDHADTLTSRHQVAYCIGETGDPHTALDLYREVEADYERVLGPDHPDTLLSRFQVAYYTGETGDLDRALDLYRLVAADHERVLGPDHPDTLISRHQVSYYTGETGDPHTALDLYLRLAADSERVLGPDHPDTLSARHEIGYWMREIGERRTALTAADDVLRRGEAAALGDPGLLLAARWLRSMLTIELAAEQGQPLPRELREAREVGYRRRRVHVAPATPATATRTAPPTSSATPRPELSESPSFGVLVVGAGATAPVTFTAASARRRPRQPSPHGLVVSRVSSRRPTASDGPRPWASNNARVPLTWGTARDVPACQP